MKDEYATSEDKYTEYNQESILTITNTYNNINATNTKSKYINKIKRNMLINNHTC